MKKMKLVTIVLALALGFLTSGFVTNRKKATLHRYGVISRLMIYPGLTSYILVNLNSPYISDWACDGTQPTRLCTVLTGDDLSMYLLPNEYIFTVNLTWDKVVYEGSYGYFVWDE